jgi:hypothetical protein
MVPTKGYQNAIAVTGYAINIVANAQSMEKLCSIYTDTYPSTYFLILLCLLVDVDFDALAGAMVV